MSTIRSALATAVLVALMVVALASTLQHDWRGAFRTFVEERGGSDYRARTP